MPSHLTCDPSRGESLAPVGHVEDVLCIATTIVFVGRVFTYLICGGLDVEVAAAAAAAAAAIDEMPGSC